MKETNPHLLAYDPHLSPVLRFDSDKVAAFSGAKSLPFHPGEHRRVAIKVIDPRGNEVVRMHRLNTSIP